MYPLVHCGYNSISTGIDIAYYVEVNGIRYQHFLHTYAYPQVAVNANSDNMWFPMPSNRMVYTEVPLAFSINCHTFVSVIGYR